MSGLDQAAVPVIPRGVRLHHDTVRSRWVLLAPERTIDLDPIGLAILQQIDGLRSFGDVVAQLASIYDAPAAQIEGDVAAFLAGLADRRILEFS